MSGEQQQGTTMPRCRIGKAETQAHPAASGSGWEETLLLSCSPGSHPADHPEHTYHPGQEPSSLGLNVASPRSLHQLPSPRHGRAGCRPQENRMVCLRAGCSSLSQCLQIHSVPGVAATPARKCPPCVY